MTICYNYIFDISFLTDIKHRPIKCTQEQVKYLSKCKSQRKRKKKIKGKKKDKRTKGKRKKKERACPRGTNNVVSCFRIIRW